MDYVEGRSKGRNICRGGLGWDFRPHAVDYPVFFRGNHADAVATEHILSPTREREGGEKKKQEREREGASVCPSFW